MERILLVVLSLMVIFGLPNIIDKNYKNGYIEGCFNILAPKFNSGPELEHWCEENYRIRQEFKHAK